MKDEIKFTEKVLQKWINSFKETCMIKNPKLMRVSLVFRSGDTGEIEERAFSHQTFDYERDMQ